MTIFDDLEAIVNIMKGDGEEPYFMHGHRLEASNMLRMKDQDMIEKYKKFPLVFLREPIFSENKDGVEKYNLNIAIIAQTMDAYDSADREENVFKPILDPFKQSFIDALLRYGQFFWPGHQNQPSHTEVRRKYLGVSTEEGNVRHIFNEPVDALELINFRINREIPCLV